MNHDLEHSPARTTNSDDDPELTSLRWPDPSPLQSWWDKVMGGGSPLAKPGTSRMGGQQAPLLRTA
jgi:hypothetical protein